MLTAASRLNCGLIMPSGPGSRRANFFVETYEQILKRAKQVDWQERPILEVATNQEEFDFGKRWLRKAKADPEWLRVVTEREIYNEEPRIKTHGGVLFCKVR